MKHLRAATTAAITIVAALTLSGCGTDSATTAPPKSSSATGGTTSDGQPPWPAPVVVAPLVAAADIDLGPWKWPSTTTPACAST